jgi:uncharacterized membrane-anchored protein
MKTRSLIILIIVLLCALVVLGQNRKRRPSPSPSPVVIGGLDETAKVKWQEGPSVGDLGNNAEVQVPAGYVFAGAGDTRLIMEATRNPVSGREMGFVAPAGEDWFAVFEFDDVGYVRDDEKNSLDADALLESIKAGTETGNKERLRRGWPTMSIVGWEQPPRYDEASHNLEWAVRAESEGSPVINYNTRLLGRGGVMEVTLVTNPTMLGDALPKFKNMLAGFDFKQGQKYAEFRKGDKIAQYGLTGLIVGGTTAVLVKSGAFKWIWKGLVAGAIILSGFLRKLFSRKTPSAES